MDFRKDNKKKGEKSLWEQSGRKPAIVEEESETSIQKEMDRPKRFKLIQGLMDKGLGSTRNGNK